MDEIVQKNIDRILADIDFELIQIEDHNNRIKDLESDVKTIIEKTGIKSVQLYLNNGEIDYENGELHIHTY